MYLDLLSHKPSRWRVLARSVWAEHVVRRWKRSRAIVLAAIADVVIVLGLIGFTKAYPKESILDSLYRTLQLFALGGAIPPRGNVYLEIGRFLGPLVIASAIIGTVVALYREQLKRFRMRHLRGHIVVAGLGAAGFRVAKAFAADDWSVVAIERDPANVAIEGCRERGIHVLLGDATDSHVLRQAGVGRAVLLVAMCGDDGANVDVAANARVIGADHPDRILTALVELDDFELWHVMKAQALVDRDESAFRLELVNIHSLAADLLLDEHPPFDPAAPGSPHVLVVGGDGLAQSLVIGLLRRWIAATRTPDDVLTVTLAGLRAPHTLAGLIARYPELKSLPACDLRTWEVDLGSPTSVVNAPPGVTLIYVALLSDTKALTLALTLREQPGSWATVPIVLAVADRDAGVGRTVGRGGPALSDIVAFGWLSQTLQPASLLEHTVTETLARIGHRLHCEDQFRRGVTERDDPSLVPWEQLRQSLRESNRLWADGMAAKLSALGCVVIPAPLADPRELRFQFTDEELADLAPMEHDRWSADMKRMGYRSGPRDDRHHPLIDVPFDQLPEENKEKDRDHVRTIPEVLARAGFRIHRLRDQESGAEPRIADGGP
jgi:hypothetical protein